MAKQEGGDDSGGLLRQGPIDLDDLAAWQASFAAHFALVRSRTEGDEEVVNPNIIHQFGEEQEMAAM